MSKLLASAAVLSCTEFVTDGIRNAIPTQVVIKGDTRSYTPEVQALLESRLRELCDGICRAHGAACSVDYTHEFAPTVNWPQCVPVAVRAAQAVVGAAQVDTDTAPIMASEDFGRFLQHIPGAFVFIGNGTGDEPGGVPLHNARYDFNDHLVPLGARWFAELVRQRLPRVGERLAAHGWTTRLLGSSVISGRAGTFLRSSESGPFSSQGRVAAILKNFSSFISKPASCSLELSSFFE